MRTLWRVILPLVVGLALLAGGAAAVVNRATQAWFARDVALRAQLAVVGTQGILASYLESGNRKKMEALLDDLARDESLMGEEVCTVSV
jgi:hypothetical protein